MTTGYIENIYTKLLKRATIGVFLVTARLINKIYNLLFPGFYLKINYQKALILFFRCSSLFIR